MLPEPTDSPLHWASEELLARLALPYEEGGQPPHSGCLALAIERPLPDGRSGVEIRGDRSVGDSLATVSRRLADGTFVKHHVVQLAPGRRHIILDLAIRQVEWLGRREEYGEAPRDRHGRTRFEACELASAGLADCPAADLFAEAVHETLVASAREADLVLPARQSPWPGDRSLAIHLSHDVDKYKGRIRLGRRHLEWAMRATGAALLGRWDAARRNLRRIHRRLGRQTDPDYTIPRVMDLERRYGARSSFYFFAMDRPDRKRAHTQQPYGLSHPGLAADLRQLNEGGWEVGLHGLYVTHRDGAALGEERRRLATALGDAVIGIRQHFLRLAIPETWRAQEEAGFAYDATLGWTRVPGFRAATAVPFRVWDVEAGRALDLMEIPLTAMDAGIEQTFGTDEAAFERLQRLMDKCRRPGGVFSLLVHPHRFVPDEFPFWPQWMERLLGQASDLKAWVTSGREIYRAVTRFRDSIRLDA